jgi:hypothetical protein
MRINCWLPSLSDKAKANKFTFDDLILLNNAIGDQDSIGVGILLIVLQQFSEEALVGDQVATRIE